MQGRAWGCRWRAALRRRRLAAPCLGKRDPDRQPAARPGVAQSRLLPSAGGPLTTCFCIVLLRNLNVQPVKRSIKALTRTFNCYLYFWKGVAVRIKYFVGIKYLLSTFSSCLVCARLELPGLRRGAWCAGEQSCGLEPHPVSSPSAEVSYSACAIIGTPKYCSPRAGVIHCLFLCVNTTSDWSLNCSPVFFPLLLDQLEGCLKGESKVEQRYQGMGSPAYQAARTASAWKNAPPSHYELSVTDRSRDEAL